MNYRDALLTHGPPTEQGFFYDFGTEAKVVESDYERIELEVQKIIKARHKFERLECTKEQALDLFSYNKYKTDLIESKIAPG
jgi:threonyl-tRNA synthetase